ncbi:MAG TPA: nitroreductase family protein [Thermoplasmata archaeon]
MEVSEAIRKRRARRAIDTRPVEDDKVEALVEAVRLSASCFNNQPWRIVLCKGHESLEAIKGALSKGNQWATRAPLILVVAAKDPDDCKLSDRRDYYLFSVGLSIGQLELRATELGLIAHPIAGYDPLKAKEILGIPPEYVIITLVIVAYPSDDQSLLADKQKEAEATRPERKPVGENFFLDRWNNPYQ